MHTHMRAARRALVFAGAAFIGGCRSGGSSTTPQTTSAPVPPASTASSVSSASTAAPPPAVQQLAGYTITMKLSVAPDTVPVIATMKVAGSQVRMEMGQLMELVSRQGGAAMPGMSEAGPMMAGGFVLMQPGAKMTVIMPSMNMAMTMDMGAMLGGGPGGMVEIKDAQMTVDDLGAGERILGYPTRKYRINQKFTMVMNVRGESRSQAMDQTMEVWSATNVGEAEAALKAFETAFGSMQGGPIAAMKEFEAKRPPGVGLRAVMTMPKPDGTKQTMTTEMTEIKKQSFDATEFTVPAGMQTMDLGAMMSGRGRGGN